MVCPQDISNWNHVVNWFSSLYYYYVITQESLSKLLSSCSQLLLSQPLIGPDENHMKQSRWIEIARTYFSSDVLCNLLYISIAMFACFFPSANTSIFKIFFLFPKCHVSKFEPQDLQRVILNETEV